MTTSFRFAQLHRTTRLAALSSLGFILANRLIDNAYREVRDEETFARMGGIDAANEQVAANDERAVSARFRADSGFDEGFTPSVCADVLATCIDQCDTEGTSMFERVRPISTVLDDKISQAFKQSSYTDGAIEKMMKDYEITREHAEKKFKARVAKRQDALGDRREDVLERVTGLVASAKSYDDIDSVFVTLSAQNQGWILTKAAAAADREAKRLRKLDQQYDWDDMLAAARIVEDDLKLFAKGMRETEATAPAAVAA